MSKSLLRVFAKNLLMALFCLPFVAFAQSFDHNTSPGQGAAVTNFVCSGGINYYDAGFTATANDGATQDYNQGPGKYYQIFSSVGNTPSNTLSIDFGGINLRPTDTIFIYAGTTEADPLIGFIEQGQAYDGAPGSAVANANALYTSGTDVLFVFDIKTAFAAGNAGFDCTIDPAITASQGAEVEMAFNIANLPAQRFGQYVMCPDQSYGYVANVTKINDAGIYVDNLPFDSVTFDFGNGDVLTSIQGDAGFNDANLNGGSISAEVNYTFTAPGVYKVTITAFDQGCGAYVEEQEVAVLGSPNYSYNPAIDPAGPPHYILCEGDQLDITGSATAFTSQAQGSATSNYTPFIQSTQWTFVNAGPDDAINGAVLTHAGTNTGGTEYDYSFQATYEDNPACIFPMDIQVRVNVRPYAGDTIDFVDPGTSTEIDPKILCNDEVSYDLFNSITGWSARGTWEVVDAANFGGIVFSGVNNSQISATDIFNTYGAGEYFFKHTVTGVAGCPPSVAVVSVIIEKRPFAGITMQETERKDLCSSAGLENLCDLLDKGTAPDAGGTWEVMSGPNLGALTLDPAANAAFVNGCEINIGALGVTDGPDTERYYNLKYTVTTTSCGSQSATAKLRIVKSPLAGMDTTLVTCTTDGPIQLNTLINNRGSNYTPNQGVWSIDPATASAGFQAPQTWNPTLENNSGTYKLYWTIDGVNIVPPCQSARATVTIQHQLETDAGEDGEIDACDLDTAFDLFDGLDRSTGRKGASIDGQWYGPNDETTPSPSVVSLAGESGNTLTYTYIVAGNFDPATGRGCDTTKATLTINVGDGNDPGADNLDFFVCDSEGTFDLFSKINGTPELGGTWTGGSTQTLNNAPDNATFNAANEGDGTTVHEYIYTQAGSAGCPDTSATVRFIVSPLPDAGNDNTDIECSVDSPYDLSATLVDGGNGWDGTIPGTTWEFKNFNGITVSDANGAGMVDISTLEGDYTFYHVVSSPGCISDSAEYVVTVNQPGYAGIDGSFVVCTTAPEFPLFPLVDDGNTDITGTWDDPIGGIVDPNTNVTDFDPSAVTQTSPADGDTLRYIVEVEECPNDTALVIAFVSEKPNSGLSGDTIKACVTDAAAVDLFEGFVADSYDEDMGVWELDIFPPSRATDGAFTSLRDLVNNGNRNLYFEPGEPNQMLQNEFDFERFALDYIAAHGGDSKKLYEQPIFRFSYTAVDTTVGKFNGVVGSAYKCADSTSYAYVRLDRDWEELINPTGTEFFEFDPLAPSTVLDPSVDAQGNVIVCETVNDFPLWKYFPGMRDIDSCANQYDIFEVAGLNPEDALYNNDPTDKFYVDASRLINAGSVFDVTISVENECGTVSSALPLKINVEILPDAGGARALTLCSTGDVIDLSSEEVLGQPYADDFLNLPQAYFEPTPAASPGLSGRFFDPKQISFPADPAVTQLQVQVDYVIPGFDCPESRATITITINRAPKTGADLGPVEVCQGDQVLLNADPRFYGGQSDITPGTVKCYGTNCGTYSAQPYATSVFETASPDVQPGLVELYHVVDLDGCAADSSYVRIIVKERPFAGESQSHTFCSSEGKIFLPELLNRVSPFKEVTPGGTISPVVAPGKSGNFLDTRLVPIVGDDTTLTFTYSVGDGSICPSETAVLTLKITKAPSAGTNGKLIVCEGQGEVNLFDGLNGNPDKLGKFEGISGSVKPANFYSGTNLQFFDLDAWYTDLTPDTVNFLYTVAKPACPIDSATVEMIVRPAPKSGKAPNVFDTVCAGLTEFDLFATLGDVEVGNGAGDYLAGGTWTALGESGSLNGSKINPSTLTPLTVHQFRYTVNTSCGASSTVANITVDAVPFAGVNKTFNICDDGSVIPLADYSNHLTAGGTYYDVFATGGLTNQSFFNPNIAVAASSYTIGYAVSTTIGGCPADTAYITFDMFEVANAGGGATGSKSIVLCENGGSYNIFDLLEEDQQDGTFIVPPIVSASNAFDGQNFYPDRVPNNTVYDFVYIVDNGVCDADTAKIRIKVEAESGVSENACGDFDQDGITNNIDVDDDNDGITDLEESAGFDLLADDNSNTVPNYKDGVWISQNGFTANGFGVPIAFDSDNDGKVNQFDLDSDGDNIWDLYEAYWNANAKLEDNNNDGQSDDVGPNGINLNLEAANVNDFDGDGIPTYLDLDSDDDGISDAFEAFDDDLTTYPKASDNNANGDGDDFVDTDSDDDTIEDKWEALPMVHGIPADTDRDDIFDYQSIDSDSDSVLDVTEAYLQANGAPGDSDGDDTPNFQDLDSDNDRIGDTYDAGENGDYSATLDTDEDGVVDYIDPDADGDGIWDGFEGLTVDIRDVPNDADSDGIFDFRELDADGDSIRDITEAVDPMAPYDSDKDGIYDFQELDADNDMMPDAFEGGRVTLITDTVDGFHYVNQINTDQTNGTINDDFNPDFQDTDSDGDLIPDALEGWDPVNFPGVMAVDTDFDGIPDFRDLDSDNDSIPDAIEAGFDPNNPADTDNDQTPDYRDLDSDNDGVADIIEGADDCDNNGTPNYIDDADDCKISRPVSEGLSPNGDNKNDVFFIQDIQLFPKNKVTVVNRYGSVVFEMEAYDNSWDGTSKSGAELPDGTYFYSIDYGVGKDEVQTGFVQISRGK